MNNISLDSFRAISQGQYNLGFVKLTHQGDGKVGIEKANNHHILGCIRNNEDTSASADNRMVREQLVNAFRNEGASEEFLARIRERLGLNGGQQTSEVLTRNQLRDIIQSFDGNVARNKKALDAVATNVFLGTPKAVVDTFADQIEMVKSRYTVALATANTEDEREEVIRKVTAAFRDLKAAFAPDVFVEAEKDLNEAKEQTAETRAEVQSQEKANALRFERGKAFEEKFAEIEKMREAFLKKINDKLDGKTLAGGYTRNQTEIIRLEFVRKVNACFVEIDKKGVSLQGKYIKGEIDLADAALSMKAEWMKVECAIEDVERELVYKGSEDLQVNGAKIAPNNYKLLGLGVGTMIDAAIAKLAENA